MRGENMQKIVIFLNDHEQMQLEKVAKLMARDPQRQAYVILTQKLAEMEKVLGASDEQTNG